MYNFCDIYLEMTKPLLTIADGTKADHIIRALAHARNPIQTSAPYDAVHFRRIVAEITVQTLRIHLHF